VSRAEDDGGGEATGGGFERRERSVERERTKVSLSFFEHQRKKGK